MRQLYYYVAGRRSLEDFRVHLAGPLAHAMPTDPIVTPCGAAYAPEGCGEGTVYHLGDVRALPYPMVWSGPYLLGDGRLRTGPTPGGAGETPALPTFPREYWIGWSRAARPGPEDLAREDSAVTDGAEVRLQDGQLWQIPRMAVCREREPDREIGLASVWATRDGRRQRVPVHSVRHLAELGAAFGERFARGETIEAADLLELAGAALSAGYRVGVSELLALELCDDFELVHIAYVAVDFVERTLAGLTGEEALRFEVGGGNAATLALATMEAAHG